MIVDAGQSAVATAGGVLFIGASQDKTFRAFDSKTAKVLWSKEFPANGGATPAVYLGKDGKEYVSIVSGTALVTFTLS